MDQDGKKRVVIAKRGQRESGRLTLRQVFQAHGQLPHAFARRGENGIAYCRRDVRKDPARTRAFQRWAEWLVALPGSVLSSQFPMTPAMTSNFHRRTSSVLSTRL